MLHCVFGGPMVITTRAPWVSADHILFMHLSSSPSVPPRTLGCSLTNARSSNIFPPRTTTAGDATVVPWVAVRILAKRKKRTRVEKSLDNPAGRDIVVTSYLFQYLPSPCHPSHVRSSIIVFSFSNPYILRWRCRIPMTKKETHEFFRPSASCTCVSLLVPSNSGLMLRTSANVLERPRANNSFCFPRLHSPHKRWPRHWPGTRRLLLRALFRNLPMA